MTIIFRIVFILFIPTITLGKIPKDSLLVTFFNKTIHEYFSNPNLIKKQEKFYFKLIQTDIDSSNLIKRIGKVNIMYYSSKTPIRKILSRPYKRNKGRDIYKIKYKQFGEDTIDVLITAWTIEKIDRHNINFQIGCGGTMGYIPEGRFIYNKKTNIWIFYSYDELIKQEIEIEKIILKGGLYQNQNR